MTSHYTNIISIACLFLCLSIASARSSFIQQVTDGINTSQQQEKNRPPSTYYSKNMDYSENGVIISSPFTPNEIFEVNGRSRNYTWTVTGFSTLLRERYTSPPFWINSKRWGLRILPNGNPARKTPGLSLYLVLSTLLHPTQRINVVAKLRVLNQRESNTIQRTMTAPFSNRISANGYDNLVSQADLRDSSKGFVVNDELRVQVIFESY